MQTTLETRRRPWATAARQLWEVCGFHRELRREVPIGFLVTTDGATPQPVAFVPGVKQDSLAAARCAVLRSAPTMPQLPGCCYGMILYPLRWNGERRKLSGQTFPASMFQRRGASTEFHQLTIDGLRYLQEKKSGRSEPLNAAHLGGQSSNRKGIVSAA